MPRSAAWGRKISITPSSRRRKPNTLGRRVSWPASMRDISRMSLISPSNASPDWRAMSSKACCAGGRPASCSSVRVASKAFSGVRISWLTMATKRDFASVAASATARASRSAFSACLAGGDVGVERDEAAVRQAVAAQLDRVAVGAAALDGADRAARAQQRPCAAPPRRPRPPRRTGRHAPGRAGCPPSAGRPAACSAARRRFPGKCWFHSTRQRRASIIATPSDMPSERGLELRRLGVGMGLGDLELGVGGGQHGAVIGRAPPAAAAPASGRPAGWPPWPAISTEMQPANTWPGRPRHRRGASASS